MLPSTKENIQSNLSVNWGRGKKDNVYICLENGTVRRACGLHLAPCHSVPLVLRREASKHQHHTGMLDTQRQRPASRCECLKIQASCDSIGTVMCKCGSVGNLWKTFITTALSVSWASILSLRHLRKWTRPRRKQSHTRNTSLYPGLTAFGFPNKTKDKLTLFKNHVDSFQKQ